MSDLLPGHDDEELRPNPDADSPYQELDSVVAVGIGSDRHDLETLLGALAPTGTHAIVVMPVAGDAIDATALGRRIGANVVEAIDGAALRPDVVYLLPPRQVAAVVEHRLRLTPPSDDAVAPLDHLFRSIADACQNHGIAVLLSGEGTDGTLGVAAVTGAGGVTIARTPAIGSGGTMPRNAIASGGIDYVRSLEEIAPLIATLTLDSYLRDDGKVLEESLTNDQFAAILSLVRIATGSDYGAYKRATLQRRIRRRMGLRHIASPAEYIELLRGSTGEVRELANDLIISVTSFFRDPEAWEIFASEVVRPLVTSRSNGGVIRAWLPGCATGEEAYSMAILLAEEIERARRNLRIQVFASDISPEAIRIARTGVYPATIAGEMSPERLRRHFVPVGDGDHYAVSKQIREMVVFAEQNVITDPPFSRLDIICCRNLLIYLVSQVQHRILALFAFALRNGGYLFLGNAETVGRQESLFTPISKKWRIYRQSGATRVDRLNLPWEGTDERMRESGVRPPTRRHAETRVVDFARQLVLDRLAPTTVMINAQYDIVFYSGATHRYLVQPGGPPTQNLLAMAREGIRSRLRGLVRRAIDEGTASARVTTRTEAEESTVRITALSTLVPGESEPYVLVTFQEEENPRNGREARAAAPEEESVIAQLEQELGATRTDLQGTIEQLETANEELKAANEEMMSMNEELQSANEEMETSKEELQSMNEELNTVNHQLQSKVEELEATNDDLKNLLTSSDIATIFLDRRLAIKRFTPAVTRLMRLIPGDIGRPIGDMASNFSGDQLTADAEHVLDTLMPVVRELQTDDDRWYLRRVLPYRTQDNRIDGVVVTYHDITDRELAHRELQRHRDELELRVAERTAEAHELVERLRELSAQLFVSEERERRRLAEGLHDDLGQLLNLAAVRLARLRQHPELTDATEAARELTEIDHLLRSASDRVRTLTFELSPPILYELGLPQALEWLAEELRTNHGLSVSTDIGKLPGHLDEGIAVVLFRSIRELLLNVVNHADVASATLAVEQTDGSIRVRISDHGRGFDADSVAESRDPRGFGLFSIRERIGHLGGSLDVRSVPGDGTAVTITLPLSR